MAEGTPHIPALPDLLDTPPLTEKARQTARRFQEYYGQNPQWLVAAPGRINVIGEHVDYCDGLVLPMAIDRHVLMAAVPDKSPVITFHSRMTEEQAVVELGKPVVKGEPSWSNYLRGVIRGFLDRQFSMEGMKVLVDSDLPMGGGLSSSAALEVSLATLLEVAAGLRLDFSEKALICQQAEHEFAGVPCGIMDQFASVYGQEGHLMLIDCRTQGVEMVPLSDPSVTFLVINTNVKHELGNSEYSSRRAQCEEAASRMGLNSLRDATLDTLEMASTNWPEKVRKRGRHVVLEIGRTRETAAAMKAGQWRKAGEFMYASHESLQNDFQVSCVELDLVVELARELGFDNGVYGCRMTGGGFGGCCVALVHSGQAREIARTIGKQYLGRTGIHPTLFISKPTEGAAPIEVVS